MGMFMKTLYKSVSLLFIVTIIISSCYTNQPMTTGSYHQESTELLVKSDQVVRGPIIITSDADFVSQGFNGSGTLEDPFIIEGFRIATESDCIAVSDTVSHFIIRNCELYSDEDRQGQGIYLNNVQYGRVENCTIWYKSYGIQFENSNNCSAIDNRLYDDGVSIRLYHHSENCTIYGNHIYDPYSETGISLFYAGEANHIENNILEGGSINIQASESESWNLTIINNYVNGKPMGYFHGISDTTILASNFGQVILSESSRVTIAGGTFKQLATPISVGYSTDCIIRNVHVEDGHGAGIYIEGGERNLVVNNSVSNMGTGVYFDAGEEMTVVSNVVIDCNEGIRASSRNSNVVNNTVSESSEVGIYVWRNNCTVNGNVIDSCETGINAHSVEDMNCSGNTVVRCTLNGINLNGGYFNNITENIIIGNEQNGIRIIEWFAENGANTTIYGNEIGWNYAGNCYDSGHNNSWDNGAGIGNSYHDYVSDFYVIDGTAGSIDNYPQTLDDSISPIINPTPDKEIFAGSLGNQLSWNVSENYPKSYTLERNSVELDSGSWIGPIFSFDIERLSTGTYTYTLTVEDYVNGIVSDSVIVTVQNRIPHAPINITVNSDFVNQGFSGAGSSSDPYLIENLEINTEENGIDISGVTAHFVIQNCYIDSPTTGPDGASGIKIHNSQNGKIEDCEVTNKGTGVYFETSEFCSVIRSRIHNNRKGILFDSTVNCTIDANNLYDNQQSRGISLYSINEEVILTNNVLKYEGISFGNANDPAAWIHTFYNNKANWKPIAYFHELMDFNLAGDPYAEVILAECINVTVFGGRFSNVMSALMMGYCQGCKFVSNTITAWTGSNMDMTCAVRVVQSTEVTVTGISIRGPYQEGIAVHYSPWAIIDSNYIEDAGTAITSLDSDHCLIQNNELRSCWRGLTVVSDSNLVISNTVVNSNSHGIEVRNALNSIVNNNDISYCQRTGIELDASNNTLITFNSATHCGEYGISLINFSGRPYNNSIYSNIIGWNTEGNGYDDGISNLWDDNISQGNFWSDWQRVPLYNITGFANSVDRYSSAIDYGPPEVSSPEDYVIESGTPDISVVWTAVDEMPYWYEIYKNGTLLQSIEWTSTSIQIPVSNYSLGIFNLTLLVEDLSGNLVSDTVIVSVVDTTAPLLNQPENLQFLNGTTGETITWTLVDIYPNTYQILLDGVVQSQGFWESGEEITQSLDSLSIGTYNYTLSAFDTSGNKASSSVIVTVYNPNSTTTTTTQPPEIPISLITTVVSISSIAIIALVAYLTLKKRNVSN